MVSDGRVIVGLVWHRDVPSETRQIGELVLRQLGQQSVKSLGKELATSNVIVNCVTPAVIATDILKQMAQTHIDYMLSKIPMGRFGKTEEAAALVAWLCSEDCSFSTGAVFDLSGGRATY